VRKFERLIHLIHVSAISDQTVFHNSRNSSDRVTPVPDTDTAFYFDCILDSARANEQDATSTKIHLGFTWCGQVNDKIKHSHDLSCACSRNYF